MTGYDAATSRPTIFALSSGAPPCAIAVIRMSGPAAFETAERITGMALPEPHRAALRRLRDPASGETIDEGLLLRIDADRSVTGEPLVEFHCHGARAVVRDLEHILARCDGVRAAEAGEFTRRAFMNGRMDLASVEGLGDLLAAETTLQRRTALAMMGGQLGRQITAWGEKLTRLAAHVEASLDFSDEDDVAGQGDDLSHLAEGCRAIADEMRAALDKPMAHRLRDGLRVAIAGPPNAGKSTLFNALVGRDAAIVSAQAGTTRDVIEAPVALGGMAFVLADSAGLRDATDEIERIGVDRAAGLVEAADIILWLGAPDAQPAAQGRLLQIHGKADLLDASAPPVPGGIAVSALSGEGLDVLVTALCRAAGELLPRPGDYALSQRQHDALARAEHAAREAAGHRDEILIGECLRQALAALDELTGRATTDAVLDEVFSGFCIGK